MLQSSQKIRMFNFPVVMGDGHAYFPPLFRYMDETYVNSFLNDGSLRLGSFSQYIKHQDEQRQDKREGSSFFISRNPQGKGQSITAWLSHGENAYVLSTTMLLDKSLADAFKTNSVFQIDEVHLFSVTVAKQIPGFTSLAFGPCSYRGMKILEHKLPIVNPKKLGKQEMHDLIMQNVGLHPFFLKPTQFSHQLEFRFVWFTNAKALDFIDIKVPEAIQFCSKVDIELFLRKQ